MYFPNPDIKKWIHYAFAAPKNEEVVEGMFKMVSHFTVRYASITTNTIGHIDKFQLELSELEHAEQEAKVLKAVLQKAQAHIMSPNGIPSAPWP